MPISNPEDRKQYQRDYYLRNKTKLIEDAGRRYEGRKDEITSLQHKRWRERKAWIRSLKVGKRCAQCPETHPACLDFHHTDPEQKEMCVGSMKGYSKKRILEEIAKCILICSNCHRKLHEPEWCREHGRAC